MMIDIAANYTRIREQVAEAERRSGRQPNSVTIVCAAKAKGPAAVQAALTAGATDIGENYVQEAQQKIVQVTTPACWHLIGHLQRNKAKTAVQLFTLIHSLDSVALARELHRQGEKQKRVVRTLIEVNLGGETTKSGIALEEVEPLLEAASALSHIQVEGFMTVPPPGSTAEAARPYFRTLAELRDRYARFQKTNVRFDELSMGMTDDFPVAIEEGATIVRIGRAIFGER
ncbi:MAG: YggS family pyridoxal phosphate-dependent enzyme [Candidatus Binatia bacterium]